MDPTTTTQDTFMELTATRQLMLQKHTKRMNSRFSDFLVKFVIWKYEIKNRMKIKFKSQVCCLFLSESSDETDKWETFVYYELWKLYCADNNLHRKLEWDTIKHLIIPALTFNFISSHFKLNWFESSTYKLASQPLITHPCALFVQLNVCDNDPHSRFYSCAILIHSTNMLQQVHSVLNSDWKKMNRYIPMIAIFVCIVSNLELIKSDTGKILCVMW